MNKKTTVVLALNVQRLICVKRLLVFILTVDGYICSSNSLAQIGASVFHEPIVIKTGECQMLPNNYVQRILFLVAL